VPCGHATFEVANVEALFLKKCGGTTGTTSRATDTNDATICGQIANEIGNFSEGDVSSIATSTGTKFSVFAYVKQQSAGGDEVSGLSGGNGGNHTFHFLEGLWAVQVLHQHTPRL
jgi:hypothetical protein